ncbi:MAG: hypothetical protein HWE07_06955 [Cytophagia bacterium]|nr:hypothetical protein [Cytophagia bacterium]
MELEKERFFKKYGFESNTTEEEFKAAILAFHSKKKHILSALAKNLIALRIIQESKRQQALKFNPNSTELSLNRIFKGRLLQSTLTSLNEKSGFVFPKMHMSIVASIILISSIMVWIVWITVKLVSLIFNSPELFLAGIDFTVILAPIWPVILLFPTLGGLVFSDFFAIKSMDGIKTLSDLVNYSFEKNYRILRENDFTPLVEELIKLQKSN